MKENKEKFLCEEWEKEADRIIAEVESASELSEIKVTEEMDQSLMQKIKEYEEERAFENLSEDDQEAVRLGRKLQEKRKRKSPRRYLAVAAVAIMVMAFGITSMGGPERIVTMVKQMMGGRENIRIESEDENRPDNGTFDEEAVYEQIKDELGVEAVRLRGLPEGTEFIKGVVMRDAQRATLAYQIKDNVLAYEMTVNYSETSFGYDIEDELLSEYIMHLEGTDIYVKQYKVEESGDVIFTAQFEVNKVAYLLSGDVSKSDFELILKNLHFF